MQPIETTEFKLEKNEAGIVFCKTKPRSAIRPKPSCATPKLAYKTLTVNT